MADYPHVEPPVNMQELYAAFSAADQIVQKKYLYRLQNAPCIELSDEKKKINVGDNVSLYRIARFTYDISENIQEKLTTVYSTVFSLKDCGLVMLMHGHKDHADLFIGIVSNQTDIIPLKLENNGQALKKVFSANFPGSNLIPVNIVSNIL